MQIQIMSFFIIIQMMKNLHSSEAEEEETHLLAILI